MTRRDALLALPAAAVCLYYFVYYLLCLFGLDSRLMCLFALFVLVAIVRSVWTARRKAKDEAAAR